MAPRAFWTGHLRLSLVNIPVKLYPATTSERRIELHQIHEPSGKRIRYQKVAPGVGPVENEEIIKGYEYEKGKYVLIDPKEIDELKLEAKQTIELVRFVDEDAIDDRYYETPYYLLPDGDLADEVAKLKRQDGKDLVLFGGAAIACSLMMLGLIDEYRIMITPTILGGGTPLFRGGYGRAKLALIDSKTMDTGSVILTYRSETAA